MKDAIDVLLLFIIPLGGGIPAGVVLAHNRAMLWPEIMLLYFISDCLLAIVFDPIMHSVRKSAAFAKINPKIKTDYLKNMERFGFRPNPFSLIVFTFGSDPMTGRVATHIAGHGFLTGWTLAIIGDMFFFVIVMASTLWLDNLLGNGTAAAVIVMILLLGIPAIYRRIKGGAPSAESKSAE